MPQPVPPEPALLSAPPERLDDAALLAAVRAGEPEDGGLRFTAFRRLADWFLPERLRRAALDTRRRARFVVLMAFAMVPFYAVLAQQLWESGLRAQSAVAAAFGLAVLGSPFLLRLTRSHVVPGSLVCVLNTLIVFIQAYTDAGLSDPILYWAALVPLAAALSVGPWLSLVSALLNVAGIGFLYALTLDGHPFPHATPQPLLDLAAFLSVSTASVFAFVWGWLYEGQTLRELRLLNGRLGQLRAALSHSEARYRSLFERVPLGVYRTTPDGQVIVVNPALVRLLGYDTVEEVKALALEDAVYVDPEQRARFREEVEREGEVQQFAAVWKRKDGRHRHVRLNARCVYDADGTARYYEGTVEDVTAQRRAQQALRKSEERFRSLVQNASDVTAVLDRDGALTYLSPSVARVLGYAPEALLGQSPFAFVHPEDRRRVRALFRRSLRRAGDLGSVECRVRHAEGHYVYVESAATNRLADAVVGGLVLNARDVTERKRAEAVLVRAKEQAEEVARLKSAFLANMSHEIRTPLTGILGFAGILAEEVTDPQQREFVALIEKSGRRLMDTLNSVLDLARLEAGRMELLLEPRPLGPAAEECARLMQPLARERGLTLEARVLAPDAEAAVDGSALHRILTNLVGNAVKFTEQGGVTVEVDATATEAVLRVRDTGVGIAPEFLSRLFNEFEQESTGIGRSHEGSGLGLTITRELVERMGGRIAVESVKGEGSVFTVAFPRVAAEAAPEEPAPGAAPVRGRLLVVDDNANTCLLLGRMLRGTFAIDTVGTAREGLDAAGRTAYDAVLLDINLGADVSGEDVMRQLRALPAYADVPIVAFTAYALPGDRERFLHAGFSGYLSKPFSKGQLLDLLDELLGDPSLPPEAPAAPPPVAEATLHFVATGPGAHAAGDGAAGQPATAGEAD
ncbi:MAG TPA: PAS domain S-box protein [Rubricoccaceae bacterium]|nr:PAS domain S-box protein [Rubricoccaceae bacterium]